MRPLVELDGLLARRAQVEARLRDSPDQAARLKALRAWQAARLAHTYQDLRADPRHAPAVEFFLSDLYGPQDFTRRDRDLARAVSSLSRALPRLAIEVLVRSIELQVLTAELDQGMLAHLAPGPLSAASYAAAYQAFGSPQSRARQIELIIAMGEDLDRIVRHPLIGLALRAAHAPAHALGLGALQDFLERGFAAFKRMHGAQHLLRTIRERETTLAAALLQGDETALDHLATADPGKCEQ